MNENLLCTSLPIVPPNTYYRRLFKLRLELVVFVLVIIFKIIKFSRTKQSFTRNPEVVNSARQSVSK